MDAVGLANGAVVSKTRTARAEGWAECDMIGFRISRLAPVLCPGCGPGFVRVLPYLAARFLESPVCQRETEGACGRRWFNGSLAAEAGSESGGAQATGGEDTTQGEQQD